MNSQGLPEVLTKVVHEYWPQLLKKISGEVKLEMDLKLEVFRKEETDMKIDSNKHSEIKTY